MSTKEKIIKAATQAFNEAGFGAVSLFELAQKLGMSRGNLAYHFKDKDALLQAISDQLWEQLESERNKSRQMPSFENLHNEAQLMFKLQKAYSFIFLDHHVLTHPMIKKKIRELSAQTIADNKAAIAFSIKLGNLSEEAVPGVYNTIAILAWTIPFYWLSQQHLRNAKGGQEMEKMIWSLLVPHFTEKGQQAFMAYFGKDYYNNLGPVFETDLNDLIKI